MTKPRSQSEDRKDLLIEPLDFLILEKLPAEGTLIFSAYPDGKSSEELSQTVAEGNFTTLELSTRLRVLHKAHAVVTQRSFATKTKTRVVWQRTKLGEQWLSEWKGRNGSHE
jgi:hypothetical protein